jgi:VIT1/CCC1 family predicted Fe2+/Mn2+ transporter
MSSPLSPEDQRTHASRGTLASVVRRLRRQRARIVPHPGPATGEQRTAGGHSGALRAAIFGVNDGLVSNLALIFGVAGAGVSSEVILVTGIAGLLAGAFSMAAGEYISMKVQREVFERLIHLEAHEIGSLPQQERDELVGIYERKGVPHELASQLADVLMADPEVALETHAREELGLDVDEGLGSPWAAASSSFVTFSFGAFVPLAPFLVTEGTPAVVASGVVSAITLLGVGAATSFLTGRSAELSAIRMLSIGASAAAITYGVGKLLDVAVT